nr:TIGR03089 family protein [Actinomyces trachealis]
MLVNRDLNVILESTSTRIAAALTWYDPLERIELGGKVLGKWLAKVTSMVTAEAGNGNGFGMPLVHLALPPHWRTVVWACGTWRAGGTVELGTPASDAVGLSVAARPEDLLADAEAQVLTPLPSLALRWPTELPPLVLDGAADLMTHPDQFPAVTVPPQAPVLVVHGPEPVAMSHQELMDAVLADLSTGVASPLLVHEATPQAALLGCLRAWAAGRRAVLVSPEADRTVLDAAIRQEGATTA